VGKTILIDAILAHRDPWPATRDTRERETRPTPFCLPSVNGKATLWDMPKRCTQHVPDKDYLEEQGYRYFHGVIIVEGCNGVQEFDLVLIKMLEEARVPWYYVNNELEHGRSHKNTLAAIRARINAQLERAGLSSDQSLSRVYTVSTEPELTPLGDWAKLCYDLAHDLERSTQILPTY
jgi:hypothetical protein